MIGAWPWAAAWAGEPLIAVTVTDPVGTVVFDDTVPLPFRGTFPAPGRRHVLGVFAARFDGARAVLELATGRERDGKPESKWTRSDELDPFVPFRSTVRWRDEWWTVHAVLGETWAAPDPVAGACAPDTEGPVTAHVVERRYDDGTAVVLSAGTPVIPLEGSREVRVERDGLAFSLLLDEGDLGPVTEPRTRFPPAGSVPRTLGAGVVGRTGAGDVRSTRPVAVAGQPAVDATAVTVQVPCVRLVLVPAPQARPGAPVPGNE